MIRDSLVSVIMPAFNSEGFIGEAICSVLDQSYQDIEILVTDDCSLDSTELIVRKMAEKDSRVKYFRLEKNGGAAMARNNSLRRAKGRYIAFLDADDIWLPGKLDAQLSFMRKSNCAFSFTGYSVYRGDGDFEKKVVDSETQDSITYEDLLKKTCTVGCSTVILDRTLLPTIEMTNIRTGQDYALWLRLLRESGLRAYNLKKRYTGYRVLKNSISRNKFKKIRRQWQIYRQIEKIYLLPALYLMYFYARNAVFRR